jgi:threonine dehydrogenase-like Zn-dependent dehydrogenase
LALDEAIKHSAISINRHKYPISTVEQVIADRGVHSVFEVVSHAYAIQFVYDLIRSWSVIVSVGVQQELFHSEDPKPMSRMFLFHLDGMQ